MKTFDYQQEAVRDLLRHTMQMLTLNGTRHTLVFRAPTGSGKTVMTTMALEQITLQTRGNGHELVMIWIAPNALHEQSYFKMKSYFSETRELRPVMYDELDHTEGLLHPGEVLFVNWESINKEKNIMVRETEQGYTLFEITRRTREAGHPIIVVIDEEHDFWSATADKSKQVLDKIDPKIELRVSATPRTTGEQLVNIPRERVVEEEMIKEGIVLNEEVRKDINDERSLTQHLLELSLRKRQEIAEAYRQLEVNINPLLLIQLPNDNNDKLTDDDNRLIESIKNYLELTNWSMTIDNGRLAVWLSKEKENLNGIEQPDSMVNVLLFKQAIAKGWDCPRAAVLLIFRRLNSSEFTMQTVGRILRMPEQHFYPTPLLNKGYVYTDVSSDRIEIVQDGIGYISRLVAKRRDDITLISLDGKASSRLSETRNRLGSDFKQTLRQTFIDHWGLAQTRLNFDDDPFPCGDESPYAVNRRSAELKAHVTFDVKQVQVEIPENVDLNLEGVTELAGHKVGFARRGSELRQLFGIFCTSHIGPFEKLSAATLGRCLLELMEELFECYENEAVKIILSTKNDNNRKYADIVNKAISTYARHHDERKRKAAERAINDIHWELPADRLYEEETNEAINGMDSHALLPFIRQRGASSPEKRFETFLEEHKEYLDWWYKNGDKGRDHYAIAYTKSDGSKSLFYVDFIIRMKSGRILLFDTKSANSDSEAPAKHNALIDYVRAHQDMGGGIIVENSGNWLYSDTYINNTTDLSGWKAFFPDQE
ncbi:MAG: DEAD/DEAH box helicase family protein [Bacteroidales bacterium]|nr:DEAD/DEAH box helicase family protein [Bacteroidales bacterium]